MRRRQRVQRHRAMRIRPPGALAGTGLPAGARRRPDRLRRSQHLHHRLLRRAPRLRALAARPRRRRVHRHLVHERRDAPRHPGHRLQRQRSAGVSWRIGGLRRRAGQQLQPPGGLRGHHRVPPEQRRLRARTGGARGRRRRPLRNQLDGGRRVDLRPRLRARRAAGGALPLHPRLDAGRRDHQRRHEHPGGRHRAALVLRDDERAALRPGRVLDRAAGAGALAPRGDLLRGRADQHPAHLPAAGHHRAAEHRAGGRPLPAPARPRPSTSPTRPRTSSPSRASFRTTR